MDKGEMCDDRVKNGHVGSCNCDCSGLIDDTISLANRKILSGEIQNKTLSLKTVNGDSHTFKISQIDKLMKNKNDIIVLRSGDRLMGSIQEKSMNIKSVNNRSFTVQLKDIKEVTFLENRKNIDCH